MLGVSSGFAKEDRAGSVLHGFVVTGDAFAVRFHGELLEIGGEPVEVLVESSSLVSEG